MILIIYLTNWQASQSHSRGEPSAIKCACTDRPARGGMSGRRPARASGARGECGGELAIASRSASPIWAVANVDTFASPALLVVYGRARRVGRSTGGRHDANSETNSSGVKHRTYFNKRWRKRESKFRRKKDRQGVYHIISHKECPCLQSAVPNTSGRRDRFGNAVVRLFSLDCLTPDVSAQVMASGMRRQEAAGSRGGASKIATHRDLGGAFEIKHSRPWTC
jgi:hypothetical protein